MTEGLVIFIQIYPKSLYALGVGENLSKEAIPVRHLAIIVFLMNHAMQVHVNFICIEFDNYKY